MGALIRLELRRNRSAFLSAAAVFMLSLPAAFFYSRIGSAPLPLATALGGLLYFWAAPGALLAAMLFGIYGGVQLGAGSARSVEEALPLSMRKHAFAGMFAVLIHSVLFALLVWAAFAACVHAGDLPSEAIFIPPAVPLVVALFYVCVYALGSGGGGMVAGLAVSGLLYAILADVFYQQKVYGSSPVDFVVLAGLYLLTLGGIAGMLWVRAQTLALLPKNALFRNCVAAAFLMLVLLADMAASWRFRSRLQNALLPLEENSLSSWQLRSAPPEGAILAASARGRLALVKAAGGIEVLFSPSVSEYGKFHYAVVDAGYSRDGTLWCLFRDGVSGESRRYKLWRMTPSGGRELMSSITGYSDQIEALLLGDGEPLLLMRSGTRTMSAPVPADGKPLWREVGKDEHDKRIAAFVKAGFPGDGGPEGAGVSLSDNGQFYAHTVGNKLGPIPLSVVEPYSGKGWRSDGWKMEGVQLLRVRGAIADLVIGRRFLVGVDAATGKVVSSVKLPSMGFRCGNAPERYYARQDGFFLSCGRYLYFSDWSGKASRIAL